jgi:hypothetical protein
VADGGHDGVGGGGVGYIGAAIPCGCVGADWEGWEVSDEPWIVAFSKWCRDNDIRPLDTMDQWWFTIGWASAVEHYSVSGTDVKPETKPQNQE